MHLQTLKDRSDLPSAILTEAKCSANGDDNCRLFEEKKWRRLTDAQRDRLIDTRIIVSRWSDSRSGLRQEKLEPSPFHHVIAIALKATCLKLNRGSSTIFDGSMRAGTLHVTGPGEPLIAEFRAPCDFVHFHVSSDYLRDCRHAAGCDLSMGALNDLVIRDPLAELLGRTLIADAMTTGGAYPACVGETLIMRVAGFEKTRQTVNPLPKWRLKRVQEYVSMHLAECISLADLAGAVGLSRMHFAAQFRAATGCRPRDYIQQRRIGRAREILLSTDMPLVEVAMAVGFQEQSYFSTVFKQLTDETPARWRQANKRTVTSRSGRTPFIPLQDSQKAASAF
jgi:AraC family transcriptional regulator